MRTGVSYSRVRKTSVQYWILSLTGCESSFKPQYSNLQYGRIPHNMDACPRPELKERDKGFINAASQVNSGLHAPVTRLRQVALSLHGQLIQSYTALRRGLPVLPEKERVGSPSLGLVAHPGLLGEDTG